MLSSALSNSLTWGALGIPRELMEPWRDVGSSREPMARGTTSRRFAGDASGDYQEVAQDSDLEAASSSSLRARRLCLVSAGAVALLAGVLCVLFSSASFSSSRPYDLLLRRLIGTKHPPYNCAVGLVRGSSIAGWSESKKASCCKQVGRGCPITTTPSLRCLTESFPTTYAYDCELGLSTWWTTWSPCKRVWCCGMHGQGCSTSTTSLPPKFDCSSGEAIAWPLDQKSFCCTQHGIACHEAILELSKQTLPPVQTSASPTPPTTQITQIQTTAAPPPPTYSTQIQTTAPPVTTRYKITAPPATTTTRTLTMSATPTTTPIAQPLVCNLNCYGDGAKPVTLPGATGSGDSMSISPMNRSACLDACRNELQCEGIVYGQNTCWGKRDIHTSLCQEGMGTYVTEVVKYRPWGKCVLMGDPHIISFDRPYSSTIDEYRPGEFYLIKSDVLDVQGRFGFTKRFPTASSTVGIALSGTFIKNHTLAVAWVGPEQDYHGFHVYWDKKEILQTFPSHFSSEDGGFLLASYALMDPSTFSPEARSTIGGTSGDLPSYLFNFTGKGLVVYMLLGPMSCNVVIEAKKLPVAQDGYCGNFNCDPADDVITALTKRGLGGTLPPEDSLFAPLTATQFQMAVSGKIPSAADCNATMLAQAKTACHALAEPHKSDCLFDVCAAGTTAVVADSIAVQKADKAANTALETNMGL
mmetsp:Transcript_243/g.542  ORF Transcript_243/g.542 Transcript_243/m.542 type:complete len:697 (-) Transcript_243:102-2192(-)